MWTARWETSVAVVTKDDFNRILSADIVATPQNVAGIGWAGRSAGWLAAGHPLVTASKRLPFVVRHIERALSVTSNTPPFWFLCCTRDGWRERVPHSSHYTWVPTPPGVEAEVEWRGAPGTLPLMSPSKDWLVCFSAHYDDPSAVLLPEAHFLMHRWYRPLRVELAMSRRPWGLRANRASYAGSDHTAESPNTHGPALRRHLKKLADQGEFAIDVSLGKSTSRRQQLRNKYLIDIDGFARTWDAWAWKMLSGSVVLSPASIWQTRFTREFEPWQHYVPLASDLSDLGDQLEWCQSHDQECKEMSDRARRHACRVYDHRRVERVTAELLRPRLGLNQAHPT